jgi:hypothetical protein
MKKLISTIFGLMTILAHGQNAQLDWAAQLGGWNHDNLSAAVTDKDGNIYSTGYFRNTADFDPGPGVFNLVSNGQWDAFVQKMDPQGNLIWAKQMGGNSFDTGNSIAVDSLGNVYTVGSFIGSVDFNPGSGTNNMSSHGSSNFDVFIQKLDSNGDFVWAKRWGNFNSDSPSDIALDGLGNLYVTGRFENTVDFDPGIGVFNLSTLASNRNTFIQKLDVQGNFIWAKSVESTGENVGGSLLIDSMKNVYFSGYFTDSADFDLNTGVHQVYAMGGTDGFVCKLDSAGQLIWVNAIGGIDDDSMGILELDQFGHLYCSGTFESTVDLDPGAGVLNFTSNGVRDAFLQKLDTAGNHLWTNQYGGSFLETVQGIISDSIGEIYVLGSFYNSIDMDPGSGVHMLSSNGSTDIFLQKLDIQGQMKWVEQFGSTGQDGGRVILADSLGNLLIGGVFQNTVDFEPGSGVTSLTANSNWEVFLAKFGPCDNTYDTLITTACNELISPSGQYVWNQTGVYQDTLTNAGGCDSIITVDLTLLHTFDTLSVISCDSLQSPSGQFTWFTSGVYQDTLVNAVGCDSILTINLTVFQSTLTTLTLTVCDSFSYAPSLPTIYTSGVYPVLYQTQDGCDSTVIFDLTIHQSSSIHISDTSCTDYISPSGLYVWSISGNYTDTLLTSNGCDSVVFVDLTRMSIDTTVNVNAFILSSNQAGATYQWLDCDSNWQPINNATDSVYAPTIDGNYALEISWYGCVDTTECVAVSGIGVDEYQNNMDMVLYPNPNNGTFTIELDKIFGAVQLEILSVDGKVLMSESYIGQKKMFINEPLAKGIYLIRINAGQGNYITKFIVE